MAPKLDDIGGVVMGCELNRTDLLVVHIIDLFIHVVLENDVHLALVVWERRGVMFGLCVT